MTFTDRPLRTFSPIVLIVLGLTLSGCPAPEQNQGGEDINAGAAAEQQDCTVAPEGNQDKACPMHYEPVCGCNGKTYSNSCFAALAGVSSWTDGRCEGDDLTRALKPAAAGG